MPNFLWWELHLYKFNMHSKPRAGFILQYSNWMQLLHFQCLVLVNSPTSVAKITKFCCRQLYFCENLGTPTCFTCLTSIMFSPQNTPRTKFKILIPQHPQWEIYIHWFHHHVFLWWNHHFDRCSCDPHEITLYSKSNGENSTDLQKIIFSLDPVFRHASNHFKSFQIPSPSLEILINIFMILCMVEASPPI